MAKTFVYSGYSKSQDGELLASPILADFAQALGLKPRSKPLTPAQARKAVERLYRPRKATSHGKA